MENDQTRCIDRSKTLCDWKRALDFLGGGGINSPPLSSTTKTHLTTTNKNCHGSEILKVILSTKMVLSAKGGFDTWGGVLGVILRGLMGYPDGGDREDGRYGWEVE